MGETCGPPDELGEGSHPWSAFKGNQAWLFLIFGLLLAGFGLLVESGVRKGGLQVCDKMAFIGRWVG